MSKNLGQNLLPQKLQADEKAVNKILIISSYKRPCGIAQYVEHLEPALRAIGSFEVEIFALPVNLLRSTSSHGRAAAKKAMQELCSRVAQADVVNVQLEPGLYGVTPFLIWRRLSAILNASRKVILTYHTVPPMDSDKIQLTLRGLYRLLQRWRGNYVFDRLFSYVRARPKKFFHIVQTEREAKNFELLGISAATIAFQPLSFLGADARAKFSDNRDRLREQLCTEFSIEGRLIACFGFLSPYKGIEVAIRALAYLPDNCHLLIVGGLHPEGIEHGAVEQGYLQKLLNELQGSPAAKRTNNKIKKLVEQVHFCGALENEAFNELMAACDAIVLPYAEVGQTSSGPVAIALDMQRPVYCSRNHCFRELDRYEPGMLSFFEIGNHLELAEKLRRQDGDRPERAHARLRYLNRYNIDTRAGTYRSAVEQLLAA